MLLPVLFGLRFAINSASDPVFSGIMSLAHRTALAPPAAAPRLAPLLKPEIDAGALQVSDLTDRSVVTIKGDGLFETGSAVLPDRVKPLLARIAGALNQVPGQVLITGHTDDQPVRSLRYPSNWHLSQDRANAVLAALSEGVAPARLRAEGRADAEPLAPNDTPASRARNRRVEITLSAASR